MLPDVLHVVLVIDCRGSKTSRRTTEKRGKKNFQTSHEELWSYGRSQVYVEKRCLWHLNFFLFVINDFQLRLVVTKFFKCKLFFNCCYNYFCQKSPYSFSVNQYFIKTSYSSFSISNLWTALHKNEVFLTISLVKVNKIRSYLRICSQLQKKSWKTWFLSSTRCFLSTRPWDYPENFGIYAQFYRKSKTWFFNFNVYVLWIERNKILISQLSPPKFRYFAEQRDQRGDPMKMNFDNFQMWKWVF